MGLGMGNFSVMAPDSHYHHHLFGFGNIHVFNICNNTINNLKESKEMNNWFESKVTFEKQMENGMQKKVTEVYIFDALSWTEAEARTIEELKSFISGEFTITDIKRAKISEMFFLEDGEYFFRAKVQFITIEEKGGTEKKTSVSMLVQANDIDQAHEVLKKGMAGTMADWVCASMTETKIMDVFPYSNDAKKTITLTNTSAIKKLSDEALNIAYLKNEISIDVYLEEMSFRINGICARNEATDKRVLKELEEFKKSKPK